MQSQEVPEWKREGDIHLSYGKDRKDCEKCHCYGCANFCYVTCKSHSCLVNEGKNKLPRFKILCRTEPIEKEKVEFT